MKLTLASRKQMTDVYPKAVLISDEHYTPSSLPVAHAAMKQALAKAEELEVPLISCGDLLDSKAIIRAECANALIELFSTAQTRVIILVGNHTLINEKGSEHSLNFLSPYAEVIDEPKFDEALGIWLIPYQSNQDKLKLALAGCAKGSTIIMHQGVLSADMGHYVKDSTSLPREEFADFRVISGHYHKAQDIKCGRPRKGALGLFSYVGSPYTTSFSEANDGPKGFRILYSDGILESVPTNLRKHIILDRPILTALTPVPEYAPGDLVWFKLRGPKVALDECDKDYIGKKLFGHSNFKLDKIPDDVDYSKEIKKDLKDSEILDSLIDSTLADADQKKVLKGLWREVVEGS